MTGEIRNKMEGSLYWVQGSGNTNVWATASAPSSGLLGFVTNFTFTSGQTIVMISDRGIPNHPKVTSKQAPQLSFTINEGITAQYPENVITASGASMPLLHLEFKQAVPETPSITGNYYQFHSVPLQQIVFTEAEDANTRAYTMQAVGMSGVNPSGFLS